VFLLYDLALLLAALLLAPYYLLRGWRYGKSRRGIRERLGFFPADRLRPLQGREVFWVHAVSVGETRAAIPLVKALRKNRPDAALVVSNVTETGHAIAAKIPEVDLCLFFPFDLSWVVKKVLKRINPRQIILVETELWPNFVRVSHQLNISMALINGRISDRSFPRYRMAGRVVRKLLGMIGVFCMQTELDAWRIRVLGAPDNLVKVTGNVKFDVAPLPDSYRQEPLRLELGLPQEVPVWVAGSTHAGEEVMIIEAFERLRQNLPELRLILVPRHPERCDEVTELLRSRQLGVRRRSQPTAASGSGAGGEVLLGDTLGEMLKFYAAADVVFVGGSLVPIGGHNILEALQCGRPVVFGQHMHNFKEITRLVLDADGGRCVSDVEELVLAVTDLLGDPDLRQDMVRSGQQLMAKNAGATGHTLAYLQSLLGD